MTEQSQKFRGRSSGICREEINQLTMPSFRPTKLWEASPHTLAKLEIIERYLFLWFTIVGSNPKNRRLIYIDGFAGPGKYTNTNKSSPLLAMQSAREALNRPRANLQKTKFCFFFVEKNSKFAESLHGTISAVTWPNQFQWVVENGSFEAKVGDILKK
jgi:three-Cys-motif partner protein